MTFYLLTLLVIAVVAGAGALVLYSRTQHGFFLLRDVRRAVRRAAYTCNRRLTGAVRRGVGPLS